MKRLWLALGIFAGGCLTSNGLQYDAMSETNQYHIARVHKGMSQRQVLQIMHKPYSYETFQVSDDIYDIWFYVTRPTGLDQSRMVPQNLTPLTFKNGVLVGTGYSWYYYAMKEQAGEEALQKPAVQKPKPQHVEDKEFEKSLKPVPQKQAAPAKSQTPEKLPPNVHIISKTEDLDEPISQEEPLQKPCQAPCIPCPREECGPSRFTILSVGMSETQVFKTLGKPMKHETFGICSDVYDVWFYDTIASKTGKPSIMPQNQTILTFQNAILISMDDEKYFELKKQLEAKKEAPVEVKDVSQNKVQVPIEPQGSVPLSVTSIKAVSKLKKGMTESEVQKALGSAADQETFTIQSDTYDVWFYEVSREENRKIPLTFKNGILVGKTEQEYRKFKSKCKDCYDKEGERMEEDEAEQNFNYW